jgi:hypothetical protein
MTTLRNVDFARKTDGIHIRYRNLADTVVLGSVTKNQVLDLLNELEQFCLINRTGASLLRVLVKKIPSKNFMGEGCLVNFYKNKDLGEEIGRCASTVSLTLSNLRNSGYVVMRDSPSFRRYGFRKDKENKVIKAYGIDLSILIARYDELSELLKSLKVELLLKKELVSSYKTLRRQVRGVLNKLEVDGKNVDLERSDFDHLLQVIDISKKVSLKKLQEGISLLENFLERLLKLNTSYLISLSKNITNNIIEDFKKSSSNIYSNMTLDKIPFKEAFPKTIKKYLKINDPNINDFIEKTNCFANHFQINKNTLNRAYKTGISKKEISIILSIMIEKEDEITSSGGYFHNMIKQWENQQLHLLKTIYGFAKKHKKKKAFEEKAFERKRFLQIKERAKVSFETYLKIKTNHFPFPLKNDLNDDSFQLDEKLNQKLNAYLNSSSHFKNVYELNKKNQQNQKYQESPLCAVTSQAQGELKRVYGGFNDQDFLEYHRIMAILEDNKDLHEDGKDQERCSKTAFKPSRSSFESDQGKLGQEYA